MAEDWLIDVRKYAADADEAVVKAIVGYCGIALQSRDSQLVAFSDRKETDLVRENYCKKKLALTDDDATLDAAIAAVGQRMKADRTKNRVTVYYLLAEHFDVLDIFGGAKQAAANAAGAAAAAAIAAAVDGPAAELPADTANAPLGLMGSAGTGGTAPPPPAAPPPAALPHVGARHDNGFIGWAFAVAVVVLGAIVLAALLAKWSDRPAVAPAPAVVAAAPAAPVAPPPSAPAAAPEGAGVTGGERDGRPMLTVYFDTGSAAVTPDFAAVAAPVLAYLEANPGASVAISGFNDATGNAAANAELSKNRAQNVQAALLALGLAADRARLEKPDETTTTDMSNSEARRVEVVVTGG